MSPTERAARRMRDTTLRTGLAVVAFALVFGYVVLSRSVPFVGGDGGRLVRVELPTAVHVNDETPVRVKGD